MDKPYEYIQHYTPDNEYLVEFFLDTPNHYQTAKFNVWRIYPGGDHGNIVSNGYLNADGAFMYEACALMVQCWRLWHPAMTDPTYLYNTDDDKAVANVNYMRSMEIEEDYEARWYAVDVYDAPDEFVDPDMEYHSFVVPDDMEVNDELLFGHLAQQS